MHPTLIIPLFAIIILPQQGHVYLTYFRAKIKEAETLESFKSQLDKHLWTIPDLPNTPGYQVLNRNTLLEWMTGSYNHADIIQILAVMDADVDAVQSVRGAEATNPTVPE